MIVNTLTWLIATDVTLRDNLNVLDATAHDHNSAMFGGGMRPLESVVLSRLLDDMHIAAILQSEHAAAGIDGRLAMTVLLRGHGLAASPYVLAQPNALATVQRIIDGWLQGDLGALHRKGLAITYASVGSSARGGISVPPALEAIRIPPYQPERYAPLPAYMEGHHVSSEGVTTTVRKSGVARLEDVAAKLIKSGATHLPVLWVGKRAQEQQETPAEAKAPESAGLYSKVAGWDEASLPATLRGTFVESAQDVERARDEHADALMRQAGGAFARVATFQPPPMRFPSLVLSQLTG